MRHHTANFEQTGTCVVKNCNKVVFKSYFLNEFAKFSAALSTNKLHEDAASVQRKPE